MRTPNKLTTGLLLALLSSLAPKLSASDLITIVANPGRFASLESAAVAEQEVDWWNDSNRSDANACTESFAAVELRRFLARCLDREESQIRLAGVGELPPVGDVFLIGSADSNPLIASFSPGAPIPAAPAAAEGFRVVAFPQKGRTITVIRGCDRVGALYGVYAYLERIGMRFYGLGDRDTVIPVRPTPLPTELTLDEKPDYFSRGFYAWEDRGNDPFFLWMARNRMNLWSSLGPKEKICFLKKLGMKLMAGGHNVQCLCLNPRIYFPQHPEWYCLRDGKRCADIPPHGSGDNYCTSNQQATAELAKNFVQQCIDGEWRYADILNLWMTDVGRWCECDACQKQGTYTDRILYVTYAVRKALKAAQEEGRLKRNIQLVTAAYYETLPPPTKALPADFDYANCSVTFFPIERCYVHALADPACTEVNQAFCGALESWMGGSGRCYTGSICIGEYYNISSFKSLPVVFTHIMATDIPWYYKIGARHFHYMHAPMRLWGTWCINNYLMGRLLWNVGVNTDQILGEFYQRFYPSTKERMRACYRDLEYASANFKALKNSVYANGQRYSLCAALAHDQVPLFPTAHLEYEPTQRTLNGGPSVVEIQAAMGRARRAIDEALITCADATERKRIMEAEQRFAYGEALVAFYYHMVRTAIFHRRGEVECARREFAMAERQAEFLRTVVDLVQVSFTHANATNGLEATQSEAAYEHFRKLLDPSGPSYK